jgi:hypothetical protein
MQLFVRATAVLLITIGTWYFASGIPDYGRAIIVLVFFGTVSLLLGPYATKAGFFARFHYVSVERAGCIWIGLGILCWLSAAMFLFRGSATLRPEPQQDAPADAEQAR